jgi:beta-lactamase regulating signal transducer with metallopeptidase domain
MSDALVQSIADASIRLAIAALAVELGTRRLRRTSPSAAYRLWLLVLIAALGFPACAFAVRPIAFAHPAGPLALVFPAQIPHGTFGAGALAIYAGGAVLGLLRIAVGLRFIGPLVRRSSPIELAAIPCVDGTLVASGGRLGRLEVLETTLLSVPVTVGYLRPRILLPSDWREWPEDRLRAVVRHELAHIRRGDYLARLAGAFVQAICWFHPAVWLAAWRLALCAELACDRVAGEGQAGDEYAAHLVALAGRRSRRLRFGWEVGADTALGERIDVLLKPSGDPRHTVMALGCAILIAVLFAATPVRLAPWPRPAAGSPVSYDHQAQPLHVHAH